MIGREYKIKRREENEHYCTYYETGLLSGNVKIKTRPEEQPIDTVVPDIAEDDGRYSDGSHSRFLPSYVIQVPPLPKLHPITIGDTQSEIATFCKSNAPRLVCKRSEFDP